MEGFEYMSMAGFSKEIEEQRGREAALAGGLPPCSREPKGDSEAINGANCHQSNSDMILFVFGA